MLDVRWWLDACHLTAYTWDGIFISLAGPGDNAFAVSRGEPPVCPERHPVVIPDNRLHDIPPPGRRATKG